MISYEKKKLEQLAMPTRSQVQEALLRALFRHGGTVKEFGDSGQEVVDEIANEFGLNDEQRSAVLETVYRKENRLKRSNLWNRLLFRAADEATKKGLVSRPTETIKLTSKREWMLTEAGFDQALKLMHISASVKDALPTKSFEVQKIAKKLIDTPKPERYNPIDKSKKTFKTKRESVMRSRGFRHAVIETYGYSCSVCGLKIASPDSLFWEVEAAHIVPHRFLGRDDIWNGLALCRLHHWAFDVGWFTLSLDYSVQVAKKIESLPSDQGLLGKYDVLRNLANRNSRIWLPDRTDVHPDRAAIAWHRQFIFKEGS